MHRRASRAYGPTKAWVGHASRHAVQVPHRSGSRASHSSRAVVSTTPMKNQEPSDGSSRLVFLPIQPRPARAARSRSRTALRSEEHTSELQSLTNLVCRLLLEKKNKKKDV